MCVCVCVNSSPSFFICAFPECNFRLFAAVPLLSFSFSPSFPSRFVRHCKFSSFPSLCLLFFGSGLSIVYFYLSSPIHPPKGSMVGFGSSLFVFFLFSQTLLASASAAASSSFCFPVILVATAVILQLVSLSLSIMAYICILELLSSSFLFLSPCFLSLPLLLLLLLLWSCVFYSFINRFLLSIIVGKKSPFPVPTTLPISFSLSLVVLLLFSYVLFPPSSSSL